MGKKSKKKSSIQQNKKDCEDSFMYVHFVLGAKDNEQIVCNHDKTNRKQKGQQIKLQTIKMSQKSQKGVKIKKSQIKTKINKSKHQKANKQKKILLQDQLNGQTLLVMKTKTQIKNEQKESQLNNKNKNINLKKTKEQIQNTHQFQKFQCDSKVTHENRRQLRKQKMKIGLIEQCEVIIRATKPPSEPISFYKQIIHQKEQSSLQKHLSSQSLFSGSQENSHEKYFCSEEQKISRSYSKQIDLDLNQSEQEQQNTINKFEIKQLSQVNFSIKQSKKEKNEPIQNNNSEKKINNSQIKKLQENINYQIKLNSIKNHQEQKQAHQNQSLRVIETNKYNNCLRKKKNRRSKEKQFHQLLNVYQFNGYIPLEVYPKKKDNKMCKLFSKQTNCEYFKRNDELSNMIQNAIQQYFI